MRARSAKRGRSRKTHKTASKAGRIRHTALTRSSDLLIEDHRLVGGNVSFVETPNTGGSLFPRYLVFITLRGRMLRVQLPS